MSSVYAKANDPNYIVKGLQIVDIPYDDGSGLLIKWKPLPKERRIIAYRVYRGASHDSLFYLGKLDVDPVSGITSNEVLFYDKDFREFVSVYSPAKIKKEKGQPSNSPLFQAIPRDLKVVTPLLKHYSTLAEIPNTEFYYHSKKVVKDSKKDRSVFAGLNIGQFNGIYANVIPGHKYYYTVVAVDEKQAFYNATKIVSGVAYDNIPETPKEFYASFVRDKNRLQFDFSMPLFKDDIAFYSIYMLPKGKEAALTAYVNYMRAMEAYQKEKLINPASKMAQPKEVTNPALLICKIPTAYPYSTQDYASVEIKNGRIVDPVNHINVPINTANMNNYLFLMNFTDAMGYESYSDVKTADLINSSLLPKIPNFCIQDKIDDKGDYNQIIIGHPIAFLSQITFPKRSNHKIIDIAYDYSDNDNFKLSKIYFKLVDNNGKEITTYTEHYLDKLFRITLPSEKYIKDGFTVKFGFKTRSGELSENFYISQQVKFNEELKQLKPQKLCYNILDMMEYRYTIMKKPLGDNKFRLAKKISMFNSFYDDNIPYETNVYKTISDFDVKKNLLLVTPSIDLGYDKKGENYLSTTIFADEVQNEIANLKKKVTELEKKLATDKEVDKPNTQYELDYYKGQLKTLNTDPTLVKANQITNNRRRMSFLASTLSTLKRTFEYKLIISDGKSHFNESTVFEKNKQTYFLPYSNWISVSGIPMMIASFIFGILVFVFVRKANKGEDLFIRPIAGLEEIDNAIGRATEMGRPMLFVPGLSSIGDVATLAALSILGHITKKAAEYDTRIIVPVCDYIVLPIAQQIVKEAHYEAGRPDTYNSNDIFFVADGQFAYVAGVNGVMIRQKTATNFYMGMFYAEALIMTETGNSTGAVQIAGTDALTQIPFFITTCDYTLIGEELYAASAYLAREPLLLGTLKAQDYTKLLIIAFMIVGTILSTFHSTGLINLFPNE